MQYKTRIENKGRSIEIDRLDTIAEDGTKSACYTIANGAAPKQYIYFEDMDELTAFAEMLTEYVAQKRD